MNHTIQLYSVSLNYVYNILSQVLGTKIKQVITCYKFAKIYHYISSITYKCFYDSFQTNIFRLFLAIFQGMNDICLIKECTVVYKKLRIFKLIALKNLIFLRRRLFQYKSVSLKILMSMIV